MRKTILFIGVISLLSCSKVHIANEEVISSLSLSPASVDADGSSLVDVSVKLNKDADASKRKVVLESSAGVFTTGNLKTITVEALYEAGELVARTKLRAPISPGYIVVTAKPELRNAYNDFILKDSIRALPSLPASVSLSSSSFGVPGGFLGEAQLIGLLKNGNGKNVSSGTKVIFKDVYPGGGPVGGRFRLLQAGSDENSKVSVYYSPGFLAPGTNINLVVTVLDSAGNPTAISDTVTITVTL